MVRPKLHEGYKQGSLNLLFYLPLVKTSLGDSMQKFLQRRRAPGQIFHFKRYEMDLECMYQRHTLPDFHKQER